MRRYSLTTLRLILAIASTLIALLSISASAQALVVSDTDNGVTTEAGVSIVPDARTLSQLPTGVSTMSSNAQCIDPWLATDLGGPFMPTDGLCWRGGSVIHKNEMFALTWDSQRAYWSQTRGYVEQFMRDVADGSGTLTSPYAVTAQYGDNQGRIQNASVFGGGCIDYGSTGGADCEYGSPSGPGHDYPANGCGTAQGDSFVSTGSLLANTVCLTDDQIQSEVSTMVTQTGILGRTQPGYTPLVSVLLPPGVEDCLDTSHNFCSANATLTAPPVTLTTTSSVTGASIPAGNYDVQVSYVTNGGGESAPSSIQTITTSGGNSTITVNPPPSAPNATGWYLYAGPDGGPLTRQGGQLPFNYPVTLSSLSTSGANPNVYDAFCSYHSEVNVNGTPVAYVVQPWTAGTACDEPGVPPIPPDATPAQLSVAIGQRLVSPLSQGQIAAITDPGLDGWISQSGGETEYNGACVPLPRMLDAVTVGNSSQNPYFLQREFNNAGALEFDPNTYFGCAPNVILSPAFVVPSSIDQGDTVELDGSATASTLIVPNSGYVWNFGDGTGGTGPSVEHTYTQGGTYNVTLTVTDRGGNSETLTQPIVVLGANGVTVPSTSPTPVPTTTFPSSGSGSGSGSHPALNAHLELMPQSLKSVLRSGITVRVTSNEAANGIATVSITRAAAKRAHIQVGKGPMVRIGLGTVASITNGTVTLHLHLSKAVAKKLARLGHVALSVRLALVAAGNQHFAVDVAGRY